MRLSFTILMLGWATLTYGQKFDGLRNRLKFLQKPDFEYDTSGFSSLPRIDYQCDNENKNRFDYYHVLDMNGDGRKDLIYSGPCDGVTQTGIFLNTGRVFRKVYDNVGKVLSIEVSGSKTTVNIFREGRRCDFFSQYTQVTIDEKSQMTRNTIVFGTETKISVASRFKEDKVIGTIRTTPDINDVIKRDECNNTVKGNHLTRIHDFKDVVQINKVGPWWLILYPETGDRSWIGWMKLE